MPLFLKIWLLVGFVVWVAEFASMADALKEIEERWGRAVFGTILSILCLLFWPKLMHHWVRRDLAAVGIWAQRHGSQKNKEVDDEKENKDAGLR